MAYIKLKNPMMDCTIIRLQHFNFQELFSRSPKSAKIPVELYLGEAGKKLKHAMMVQRPKGERIPLVYEEDLFELDEEGQKTGQLMEKKGAPILDKEGNPQTTIKEEPSYNPEECPDPEKYGGLVPDPETFQENSLVLRAELPDKLVVQLLTQSNELSVYDFVTETILQHFLDLGQFEGELVR